MRILIINGPNLNLLGTREPEIYGRTTLPELQEIISVEAKRLGTEAEFFQSNLEGELVDAIQRGANFNGVILNPGAYSHYSLALRDAISSIKTPVVEVHLSNLFRREPERHESVTAGAAAGIISGFGPSGYLLALRYLVELKVTP